MKQIIFSISTAALLLMSGAGCSKFVEGYDVSPNSPSEVSLGVLLTGAEVSTISSSTGNISRIAAVLTNQQAGRLFQYEDLAAYIITESTIDNEFQQLYNGGLVNAQLLIDKAGDANPHYRGIGRVIKAMNLGIATACWGDVPNIQALKGLDGPANFNPAYDAQETVYRDIQTLLDGAISDFNNTSNIVTPSDLDDIIFAGNISGWKQMAYVLKARFHNHLSKRDASGSATMALAALDAAYTDGLANSTNDMMAPFGEASNNWNQWYAFNFTRAGYITMNQYFLDILATDPRLPLYATPNATSGAYDDQQPLGTYYGDFNSPLPLVTYFEAKFIEAEAALRANQPMRAATAYNEAVTANVTKLGVADPAFLASVANEDQNSITLEKIMTQKYIAMFTQAEVWTDWRRTNLPTLTANAGAVFTEIPRRFPTAQSERLYNSNAPLITDQQITTRFWWDQ